VDSQFIINGIAASSVYLLAGLSFQVIYSTSGFFHFAHGAVFAAGAYVLYSACTIAGWSAPLAIILVLVVCGCLGLLMEYIIFRHLRRLRASGLILLIASLGLYVVMQNILSILFGDEVRSIRTGIVKPGIKVLGGYLTEAQGLTVLTALAVSTSMVVFLLYSRIGLAMRATASDLDLSKIIGIDSSKISRLSFVLGSALGGLTGALVAMDVGLTPSMGMRLLMMGVVAMIIGGTRSIAGVILGAFLLGMSLHVAAKVISTQWQDAIAFILLLGFLLFRPEGFRGKKVRKATV
jgi:branched-chain amino acid transport system permease protein